MIDGNLFSKKQSSTIALDFFPAFHFAKLKFCFKFTLQLDLTVNKEDNIWNKFLIQGISFYE